MALSVNTVVEVRTAGNDTNGGAFVTGASGTDYSQQDNKRTATGTDDSTTDAVANGTTTITSATANFGTTIVGNVIYLAGGSGSLTGTWRQVTARTNSTTITVDASVAAGTGITMNIGGALASPGQAVGIGVVSGNNIWIKNGTYTITTASTNVSNGCISTGTTLFIEGYASTRGDMGTPPLLIASGISSFTILQVTGSDAHCRNLYLHGNNLTASKGATCRGRGSYLWIAWCSSGAISPSSDLSLDNCWIYECDTNGYGLSNCYACVAENCSGTADFQGNTFYCASINSSATSSFAPNAANGWMINCVALFGNTGVLVGDDNNLIANNIISDNASVGINGNSRTGITVIGNAFWNTGGANTSGLSGKGCRVAGSVVLSASPFVDITGPSYDLNLNNTSGAGAACRGTGFPGLMPQSPGFGTDVPAGTTGTGSQDIGLLQHADPASSGGESSSAFFG